MTKAAIITYSTLHSAKKSNQSGDFTKGKNVLGSLGRVSGSL